MTTACVVVAAGRGERLAAGLPKAFVGLAGRTLLERTLEAVAASGVIDRVVVVLPPGVDPVEVGTAVAVPGGPTRQSSVAAGLAALPGDVDVVLVHDAARALAPPELFRRVVAAVRDGHDAVVPVVPVTDTVRALDGGVVDRAGLRAVQTPQGFRRDALVAAHAALPGEATDDAGLIERHGGRVHLVDGDEEAFKVTTPLDLRLAEAVVAWRDSGLGTRDSGHGAVSGR